MYYFFQKSAEVGTGETTLPEDLGKECALKLLDEINRGGAVDSAFQWILALWMALGQKDVSECIVCVICFALVFLFILTLFLTTASPAVTYWYIVAKLYKIFSSYITAKFYLNSFCSFCVKDKQTFIHLHKLSDL